MGAPLKVGVLISGRGSNLQALIDACKAPDFPAAIVLVISNVVNAAGLARAEKAG
ncbi:MAG TPA: formyltransferase family protein, partial [Alphaproteobacteria bacterium]